MRNFARLFFILIFYFFSQTIRIFALTPAAGTSLWQYGDIFYQSVDLLITDEVKWNSKKISYEIYFPVIFLPKPKYIIIPGIYANHEKTLSFLSKPKYLPVYVPVLKYESKQTSLGVEQREVEKNGSRFIIRGNPMVESKMPFLRSDLFFENEQSAFYISSLNNPSFAMGIYNFSLDKGASSDFLKDFNLLTIIWTGFKNKKSLEDIGGAAEIKTGAYRDPVWAAGFIFSAEYFKCNNFINEKTDSYRFLSGLWFASWSVIFDAAFIYHKKNHKPGAALTWLYSSKKNILEEPEEKNYTGFLMHLGPGEEEKRGFHFTLETFFLNKSNFSLYLDYAIEHKDTALYFGLARENIVKEKDLISYKNKDSFIAVKLKTFITGKIIRINWQSYYNWHEGSSLKSLISVTAFF
ncbi:MAG: hypothetical protein OEZ13_09055 [Spirochaetia bacterium]|nr:hypothetical protein [Spirochaetia bacterium]